MSVRYIDGFISRMAYFQCVFALETVLQNPHKLTGSKWFPPGNLQYRCELLWQLMFPEFTAHLGLATSVIVQLQCEHGELHNTKSWLFHPYAMNSLVIQTTIYKFQLHILADTDSGWYFSIRACTVYKWWLLTSHRESNNLRSTSTELCIHQVLPREQTAALKVKSGKIQLPSFWQSEHWISSLLSFLSLRQKKVHLQRVIQPREGI